MIGLPLEYFPQYPLDNAAGRVINAAIGFLRAKRGIADNLSPLVHTEYNEQQRAMVTLCQW